MDHQHDTYKLMWYFEYSNINNREDSYLFLHGSRSLARYTSDRSLSKILTNSPNFSGCSSILLYIVLRSSIVRWWAGMDTCSAFCLSTAVIKSLDHSIPAMSSGWVIPWDSLEYASWNRLNSLPSESEFDIVLNLACKLLKSFVAS